MGNEERDKMSEVMKMIDFNLSILTRAHYMIFKHAYCAVPDKHDSLAGGNYWTIMKIQE